MYRYASDQFEKAFEELGTFPTRGIKNAAGFADFCVEKTANELVRGNLVALTSGSWGANEFPESVFSLEAIFIVSDVTINWVLMDRVVRSIELLDSELSIAQEAAIMEARVMGDLDSEGNPIAPLNRILTPNVVAGDTLIPKKVKIGLDIKVFALNYSGMIYTQNYQGYENVVEIQTLPVEWGKVADNFIQPLAPQVLQITSAREPSFSTQQARLGLVAFQNLTGRDSILYSRVIQTLLKVDEKCAGRLRSERPLMSDKYLLKTYVQKTELLVALMVGNYTIKPDPRGMSISIMDFQSSPWNNSTELWDDVFEAAAVMDHLFRGLTPDFFYKMFIRARLALSRATQDLEKAPEFDFTKVQLCALWEVFGSDLTSSDNLLLTEIEFTKKVGETFDFKKVDLPRKLESTRNRMLDKVTQYYDQCNISGKRDRDDRPAFDRNAPKRVNPGNPGK